MALLAPNQTYNDNTILNAVLITDGIGQPSLRVSGGAGGGSTDVSGIEARLDTIIAKNISETATKTDVAASVTSVQLLAVNTARLSALIVNNNAQRLYISYGSAADAFDGFIEQGQEKFVSNFTGAIHGIWAAGATGVGARITEFI